MKNLDEKFGKNLHHAYSLEGNSAMILPNLFDYFEKQLDFKAKSNPDFHYQKFETFGIEDGRKLVELQSGKSWDNSIKIFLIEADSMTVEAQNSLLKMFEEPTPNSHFFIIGACVKNLIPTLNSRLAKIKVEGKSESDDADILAENFLKADLPERLLIVKKLTDEIKAEKKSKSEAVELIKKIEEAVYKQANLLKGKNSNSAMVGLEMCADYIKDRSAGVKMILEYAAIVVPKIQ